LNGIEFGPPTTWPSEIKLLNIEGKIQYLEIELNLFHGIHNHYPKNLKELIGPEGISASMLQDLTEGEKIVYRVSKTGDTAYINNRRVELFWK
jgi:hypothetical protein